MPDNTLFYGDNLDVLRRYVKDESVDLIYLDPPFNSNANYNVLFAEQDGSRSAAQIQAFGDTWRWDQASARSYEDTVEAGGGVARALQAFRTLLGESNMLAYLAMMAPRLVELHRVLKPTGSLYLHCDSTASHYLKLLMDAIFEPRNFRNEIIWKRNSSHNDARQGSKHFGRTHDTILRYTKSDEHTWHEQYQPYDEDYVETFYSNVEPETGRRFQYGDLTGPGGAAKGNPHYEFLGVTRYWRYKEERMQELYQQGRIAFRPNGQVPRLKRYLDEAPGMPLQTVWTDIRPLINFGKEALGYPTQKPLALLERIIQASSNEGDLVLDPFCGCGTTVAAAQKLGRRWIGIDITHLAIGLIKSRLLDLFGTEIVQTYTVIGEPTTEGDAASLAVDDPFQFQAWALGLVGARTAESNKKGADKGIDGRLYFHDEIGGKTKQIIFSVKAGKLHAPYVRDLRGVIDREKAEIGVLLCFDEPTGPMRSEAASAGFYESPWGKHPRLQLLTIGELLSGKGVDYPRGAVNRTVRQAPRVRERAETLSLGLDAE